MTYLTGIIGHPIAHSLSPTIHNQWYKEANLDYQYSAIDIPPEKLADFLQVAKTKYKGLSVTVPHKETCRQFLATETDAVTQIGACNTIIITPSGLSGHNTDWQGWLTAFINQTKIDFKITQPKILIFGAGGAAKAVLYALNQIKATNIYVTNRTTTKGETVAKNFGYTFLPTTKLTTQTWKILINTTSLGLTATDPSPIPAELITPNTIVYDLNYTPNQLKALTKQKGAHYINGEQMLLEQAKLQHLLFT